jgi:hypothetical protein
MRVRENESEESSEEEQEIPQQPRAQPPQDNNNNIQPRGRRERPRQVNNNNNNNDFNNNNINNINNNPTLGNSRYPNRRNPNATNMNNNANYINNMNNNNINNNIDNLHNNNDPDDDNNDNNDEESSEDEIKDIFSYVAEVSNTRNTRKDPRSFQEAMRRDDKEEWRKAMKAEKRNMKEMNTFEEVKEIPDGKNIIDSKWVLTTKYNENGEEIKKKARLVARGDRQKEGIDYNETFAPVVKMSTIRYMISYAHENKLKLSQLDVECAFLNGKLKEEIYMRLPTGYDENERKIVRLLRSLYGLKQAPRCWNEEFVSVLKEMKFIQSSADPCLFIREEKNGERTLLSVFVDDLIIVARDTREIKERLMKKFKMRDLGELKWILGMKVERDEERIQISQESYINNILERFSMNDSKTAPTPLPFKLEELEKTSEESKKLFKNVKRYQEIVGALLYLSNTSRPDITYSTNYLARSMSKPTHLSFQLSQRVMKYLNGTRKLKLTFEKKEEMVGYSDASYAEDKEDRKSTGGYTFKMNGAAVT